ncbi:MAG: hypothetical protein ACRDSM_01395 [Pseudonocardiaceae bacterium]
MTMNLSGPDFFEWMGLRRVRQGGLARGAGHYYDHGNPRPGWLIPDILDGLLQDGCWSWAIPTSPASDQWHSPKPGKPTTECCTSASVARTRRPPQHGPHHQDPGRSPVEQEALP